jgi:hypothetical protein
VGTEMTGSMRHDLSGRSESGGGGERDSGLPMVTFGFTGQLVAAMSSRRIDLEAARRRGIWFIPLVWFVLVAFRLPWG